MVAGQHLRQHTALNRTIKELNCCGDACVSRRTLPATVNYRPFTSRPFEAMNCRWRSGERAASAALEESDWEFHLEALRTLIGGVNEEKAHSSNHRSSFYDQPTGGGVPDVDALVASWIEFASDQPIPEFVNPTGVWSRIESAHSRGVLEDLVRYAEGIRDWDGELTLRGVINRLNSPEEQG